MKNSHDAEWPDMQKRLRSYMEEPDADVWNKVARRIGDRSDPVWVPWVQRTASALSLIMLIWIATHQADPVTNTGNMSAAKTHSGDQNKLPEREQPNTPEDKQNSRTPKHRKPDGISADQELDQAWSKDVPVIGVDSLPESEDRVVSKLPDTMLDSLYQAPATKDDQGLATTRASRKVRMRLYGSVSPSLTFQKLTPFANDGVRIESFYSGPILSVNRLGVALQAGIQSRIGRRLEMYHGLSLYTQSQQIVYQLYSDDMVTDQDDQFEYSVTPGTLHKVIGYDMINVGVDAGVLYFLTGNRLLHKIGAGLSWHHGLKKRLGDDTYDNSRSHYLQYELLYRNELVLNRRLNVFIQPFYKHVLLSSEILREPFRVRPYRAGVTFGVIYDLP